MADSKQQGFIYTWKIENFSFCREQRPHCIASPIFMVNFLEKNVWGLRIYARDGTDQESVGCFLLRVTNGTDVITIGFKFTVFSIKGKVREEIFGTKEFEGGFMWGNPSLFTRKDMLDSATGLLPNDTLTVTCEMWPVTSKAVDSKHQSTDAQVSSYNLCDATLEKQMLSTVTRDERLNLPIQFDSNQCIAVTRIQVRQKSILWPIRRFSELRPNTKLSIPMVFAVYGIPPFLINFYINDKIGADQSGFIEIQRTDIDLRESCFVKCKIMVFSNLISDRCVEEDEHFFDSKAENDVWKFSTLLDIQKFKNEKCTNSNEEVLYLRCEFACSTSGDISDIEQTEFVSVSSRIPSSKPVKFSCASSLFEELCKYEQFTDVVLRIGDSEFKAHKIVLASQSPVFRVMFENDMTEKNTGNVDITDLEPYIVKLLLDYMYQGTIDDLRVEIIFKLYAAAEKYEVLPLKQMCSCILRSNLSVSNLCSLLTLADFYKDGDLMDELQNFIRLNAIEIFHSETWEEFMQTNLKMAGDLMLNVLRSPKL